MIQPHALAVKLHALREARSWWTSIKWWGGSPACVLHTSEPGSLKRHPERFLRRAAHASLYHAKHFLFIRKMSASYVSKALES
jgi:hypothetical protein